MSMSTHNVLELSVNSSVILNDWPAQLIVHN